MLVGLQRSLRPASKKGPLGGFSFTMVEVVLAVALLSTALVPITSLFVSGSKAYLKAKDRMDAASVAASAAEWARSYLKVGAWRGPTRRIYLDNGFYVLIYARPYRSLAEPRVQDYLLTVDVRPWYGRYDIKRFNFTVLVAGKPQVSLESKVTEYRKPILRKKFIDSKP